MLLVGFASRIANGYDDAGLEPHFECTLSIDVYFPGKMMLDDILNVIFAGRIPVLSSSDTDWVARKMP
jgi:hypothetical protein